MGISGEAARQPSVYVGFRPAYPLAQCLRALPACLPANAQLTRVSEAAGLKCPKDAEHRPMDHFTPLWTAGALWWEAGGASLFSLACARRALVKSGLWRFLHTRRAFAVRNFLRRSPKTYRAKTVRKPVTHLPQAHAENAGSARCRVRAGALPAGRGSARGAGPSRARAAAWAALRCPAAGF